MKLLALEFCKCRRRKLTLVCAGLLAAQLLWFGAYLTRQDAEALAQGWMLLLYNLAMVDAIMLPIGVDGSSMYPTLHHGDMLLLQSVGYEPKQGDVVVLTKAFRDVDGPIVKRVIAVGGQTVDIDYDAGTVAVDGQVLDEPYIHEAMLCPTYENQTHIEVPEGSIFVMGDNRNHSSDSRDVTLGTVDERYVLGRAVCVLLPFQNFGMIPEGEQTR